MSMFAGTFDAHEAEITRLEGENAELREAITLHYERVKTLGLNSSRDKPQWGGPWDHELWATLGLPASPCKTCRGQGWYFPDVTEQGPKLACPCRAAALTNPGEEAKPRCEKCDGTGWFCDADHPGDCDAAECGAGDYCPVCVIPAPDGEEAKPEPTSPTQCCDEPWHEQGICGHTEDGRMCILDAHHEGRHGTEPKAPTHTRAFAYGREYCYECSEAIQDWTKWPCEPSGKTGTP